MIAREPLDQPVDVSHSLGPFDVRYNYRSCIHWLQMRPLWRNSLDWRAFVPIVEDFSQVSLLSKWKNWYTQSQWNSRTTSSSSQRNPRQSSGKSWVDRANRTLSAKYTCLQQLRLIYLAWRKNRWVDYKQQQRNLQLSHPRRTLS